MRRGQFEAMGLAVIVVLIALGMFLYLFFSLGQNKSEFVARYNNEQLAQNTIEALLKTNVEGCGAVDVANLIEDIVVLRREPCGVPSEEALDAIASAVLGQTLESREIPYAFTITAEGSEVYAKATCDPELYQTDRPGEAIIPLFPRPDGARIELIICAEALS